MSASVNLSLHHKVQKFSSGTGSPGWSWKKGHKTVVVLVVVFSLLLASAVMSSIKKVISNGSRSSQIFHMQWVLVLSVFLYGSEPCENMLTRPR